MSAAPFCTSGMRVDEVTGTNSIRMAELPSLVRTASATLRHRLTEKPIGCPSLSM